MIALASFIPLLGPLLDKIFGLIPDPQARAQAELEFQREVLRLAAQSESEQRSINRVEAAHSTIFVAGWRPFVGWMCGLGVAYEVFRPLLSWFSILYMDAPPALPSLDSVLWELMFGMLGMGGLRTAEKIRKVAR